MWAFCLGAIFASRPALSLAQQSDRPSPAGDVRIDIPPQPLFSAIETYGRLTGVSIGYDAVLARNSWSLGLRGDFTREAALLALLKGTGLEPVYKKATVVVLVSHASARATEAPQAEEYRQPPAFTLGTIYVDAPAYVLQASHQRYARLVASGVQQALRGVGYAKAQQYRVGLRVWLTPSGAVGRSEVAESTGDPALDRAITAALTVLAIAEPPPPDMPQPVDVRVSAQIRAARR